MKRFKIILAGAALFAIGPWSAVAERPNVLLIIADDVASDVLKLTDTSARIEVDGFADDLPSLSALASAGVHFTAAYSEPSCTPTRSSIYTGLHPYHNGAPHPESHDLPTSVTTIADVAGVNYTSSLFGKWHLGDANDGTATAGVQPHHHGWDDWGGHVESEPDPSYTDWTHHLYVDAAYSSENQTNYAPRITKGNVIAAIQRYESDDDKPWFITYSFSLAHSPFLVPEGFTASKSNPTVAEKFQLMVRDLDVKLGQVLAELKTQQELDNTVILFIGDNGTHQNVQAADGTKCEKTVLTDRGLRVPLIVAEGSQVVIDGHAATTSKGWVTKTGAEDHLVHAVDLFATIADYMEADGSSGTDSISFAGYLKGDTTTWGRDHVFCQWGGHSQIANESAWFKRDSSNKLWRLYHSPSVTTNEGYQFFEVAVDDGVEDSTNGGFFTSGDVLDTKRSKAQALFRQVVDDYQQLDSSGAASAFPSIPTS